MERKNNQNSTDILAESEFLKNNVHQSHNDSSTFHRINSMHKANVKQHVYSAKPPSRSFQVNKRNMTIQNSGTVSKNSPSRSINIKRMKPKQNQTNHGGDGLQDLQFSSLNNSICSTQKVDNIYGSKGLEKGERRCHLKSQVA